MGYAYAPLWLGGPCQRPNLCAIYGICILLVNITEDLLQSTIIEGDNNKEFDIGVHVIPMAALLIYQQGLQ